MWVGLHTFNDGIILFGALHAVQLRRGVRSGVRLSCTALLLGAIVLIGMKYEL